MKKKTFLYPFLACLLFVSIICCGTQPAQAIVPVELSTLSAGNTVTFGGVEWIVLNPSTGYLLQKDQGTSIQFDSSPANKQMDLSNSSNIGYYLNTTFYNSLGDDKNLIQDHTWGVGMINYDGSGDENANTVNAKVGLLSYHDWKSYGGTIGTPSYVFWTCSPQPDGVWVVYSGGLGGVSATDTRFARPAIYLNSDILVSGGNGGTVTDQYSITYDLDGGTNDAANTDTYTYGTGLTLSDPTKTDYRFDGWYDNESFSGDAITEITSTTQGAVELYAKWISNFDLLSTLSAGDTVSFGGLDWIVVNPSTGYLLQKNLGPSMQFDPSNANKQMDPSSSSNIGYYLNTTFYDSLGTDNTLIQTHTWGVGTIGYTGSGDESANTVDAKVGLLSYNEWKSYGGTIGSPSYGTSFWTCSPAPDYVWAVYYGGLVGASASSYAYARPALYLSPDSQVYSDTVIGGSYNPVYIHRSSGGTITADPEVAKVGDTVSLTITPDTGMQLKSGTLVYNDGTNDYDISGTSFTMPDCAVTVSAEFEPLTYNITYYLDGGTNNASNTDTYTYGTGLTLADPSKDYYDFVGWYDNDTFSGDAITAISTSDYGNKDLYAKWTGVSYDITYYLDGGINNAANTATYTYGTGLTLADPSKDYYDFAGWYADGTCSGNEITVIGTSETGAKDLYAKWTPKNYNITYYLDGGANNPANTATYTYGTGLTLADPTLDYYDFGGWYDNDTFSGDAITAISTSDYGNKDLYAKWTGVSYDITYYLDGGANNAANTATYTYGTGLTLADPSKDYYDFAGWYADGTCSGNEITVIGTSETGAKDLYAKWTPKNYNITYYLDGGTNNAANTATYTYGTGLTLADPTLDYYDFGGWYDNDSFSGDAITAISTSDYGNKDLYAKWTPKSYTITYYLDGGTNNATNTATYTYGTGITLASPTKSGYTFKGWYGNESFSGDAVTAISTSDYGNKDLYAKWTKNSSGGGSIVTYYDVTATQSEGGTITLSNTSVVKGSSVTVTVTPDEEYEVSDMLINGVSVGAVKSYNIKNITEDITVKATFQKTTEEPTENSWQNPFGDVSNDAWYYQAVQYVNQKGLMNGLGQDNFGPDDNMTRAMFVTILYRLSKDTGTYNSSFSDIASGAWYENAVGWANAEGVVVGMGNNLFAPNDNLSREQIALMLYNFAKYAKLDITVQNNNALTAFNDADQVSDWAQAAMIWAVEKGYICGYNNNLDPQGNATRAEIAQIMQRFSEQAVAR